MAAIFDPLTDVTNSLINIQSSSASASASSVVQTTSGVVSSTKRIVSSDTKSQTQTASQTDQTKASEPRYPSSSIATGAHFHVGTTKQHPPAGEEDVSITSQTHALYHQQSTTSPPQSFLIANMEGIQTQAPATSTSALSTSVSSSVTSIPETVLSASSSTVKHSPSTTLATSTSFSSSSSLSITQTPVTSAGADAIPTGINSPGSSTHFPVAGIVAASILSFLAFLSVLFVIFRYCSPIRRKYDAWQEKKMLNRTYRGGLDGIEVPQEKLSRNGSPKPSLTGSRFYANEVMEPNTRVAQSQGTGLGLGNRLSLLMQHSPFQYGNSNVRESQIGMAVSDPRNRGLPTLPR